MLPAVIFVMVMLGGLGVILLFTTGNERMAGRAVRESAKAFYAAEAGANAVIAGGDQYAYDSLMAQPGDSLDLGWQPLDNGCSYRAVVYRSDNGSLDDGINKSYSAIVTGRGSGGLRGQRRLAVLFRTYAITITRAVLTGGDLEITGNMTIIGNCPGLHANGQLTGGGNVIIVGDVSASDTVLMNPGAITDTLGNIIVPLSYQAPMVVPGLRPSDFCDEADFILRNGYVLTVLTGDSLELYPLPADTLLPKNSVLGWNYDPTTALYNGSGKKLAPGTVCADGSMWVSGNTGSEADPLPLSLLAAGSIMISGAPWMVADHSKNIGLLAEGDVAVTGRASINTGIDGLIYSGSQCDFGGSVQITAQVVCRSDPDPAGAVNLIDANKLRGGSGLSFGCSDLPWGVTARPLGQRAVWQVR